MILGKGSAGGSVIAFFNLADIGCFEFGRLFPIPQFPITVHPHHHRRPHHHQQAQAHRNHQLMTTNQAKPDTEKKNEISLTITFFQVFTSLNSFILSPTQKSHNFGFLITFTFRLALNIPKPGPNTSSINSRSPSKPPPPR